MEGGVDLPCLHTAQQNGGDGCFGSHQKLAASIQLQGCHWRESRVCTVLLFSLPVDKAEMQPLIEMSRGYWLPVERCPT